MSGQEVFRMDKIKMEIKFDKQNPKDWKPIAEMLFNQISPMAGILLVSSGNMLGLPFLLPLFFGLKIETHQEAEKKAEK